MADCRNASARHLARTLELVRRQLNRRVEVQVWYDEIGEKLVEKEVIVPREVNRLKVCRTETVCKLRYKEGHAHRARVKNLIAPLHYDEGLLAVPEEFQQQVRHALRNLGGKQNVVVKFTAYTDNLPLAGRDERIYGDHVGLSKAVARRVVLAVQEVLGLPNTAVEAEGRGAASPVAANDTQQGRALNRRVEVEFWHDDPLQDLPDEPQLCPEAAGAEMVTRVYDSPSGPIDPILFENGQPVIPAGTTERLRQIMEEIKDKTNVRLRFVGYTSNERLDRRTAAVYGDDIGWSAARARRAMASVSDRMALRERQAEFEGRGYIFAFARDITERKKAEEELKGAVDRERQGIQVGVDDRPAGIGPVPKPAQTGDFSLAGPVPSRLRAGDSANAAAGGGVFGSVSRSGCASSWWRRDASAREFGKGGGTESRT